MSRYLDPTTDFGFKKIFGEEANKDILAGFITDVLELTIPVVDLRFLDKDQLPETIERRSAVYDIYGTDRDGNHFIVEMQGKMEVAKALLQKGSDPAFIAEVTGLSIDQIQQLQKPAATIRKLYPTKE